MSTKEVVQVIPNDMFGSLRASTVLLRVEARVLRAEGKASRAAALEVQLAANDEVLAKYEGN